MVNKNYIVTLHDRRSGKPCIDGTRITVEDVLGWLSSGMTPDDIMKDYPELNQPKIQACIDYDESQAKSNLKPRKQNYESRSAQERNAD